MRQKGLAVCVNRVWNWGHDQRSLVCSLGPSRHAKVAQVKQMLLVVFFVIGAKSQERGTIFDFAQWVDVTFGHVCSVKKTQTTRQDNINVRNPAAKKKQFYNN